MILFVKSLKKFTKLIEMVQFFGQIRIHFQEYYCRSGKITDSHTESRTTERQNAQRRTTERRIRPTSKATNGEKLKIRRMDQRRKF